MIDALILLAVLIGYGLVLAGADWLTLYLQRRELRQYRQRHVNRRWLP